jgi:hypothetical protein
MVVVWRNLIARIIAEYRWIRENRLAFILFLLVFGLLGFALLVLLAVVFWVNR